MAILNIFEPGFRNIDGSLLNKLFNGITRIPALLVTTITGVTTLTVANQTVTGTNTLTGATINTPQVLTAAGSTQLGAAAISAATSLALVTVATTASTHGVRLPAAVTGKVVQVGNAAAFGTKVYPSTNGKIGAASTNAADGTVLAVNKMNTYYAVNTTFWIVDRGA